MELWLLRAGLCSAIRKPRFEINILTPDEAILPGTDQPLIAGDMAVLARRYAGALFELAEEHNQLDAVAADLRAVKDLAHSSHEFHILAGNPNIGRNELIKAMQDVAQTARFGKLTANFLALVAQNRRLNVLAAMCDAFLTTLAEKRGEFGFYVFSSAFFFCFFVRP